MFGVTVGPLESGINNNSWSQVKQLETQVWAIHLSVHRKPIAVQLSDLHRTRLKSSYVASMKNSQMIQSSTSTQAVVNVIFLGVYTDKNNKTQ